MTTSKRQTILEGMLETVGAEGYENTSVRAVLDRVGVYRQAFYDNFRDKEDCYLQAYDLGVAQVRRQMHDAASEENAWTGQLRAGLGALLDFLDAEPNTGRALVIEVHPAGPEALAKRAAAMRSVHAFFERGRNEGKVGGAPALAGEGIAAGIHAVIHSHLASGEEVCELLPELMYFAVLPYFGAEAAGYEMQVASV